MKCLLICTTISLHVRRGQDPLSPASMGVKGKAEMERRGESEMTSDDDEDARGKWMSAALPSLVVTLCSMSLAAQLRLPFQLTSLTGKDIIK